MAVNEYDNETFFEEYAKMTRSQQGPAGCGRMAHAATAVPRFAGQARFGFWLRLRLALQVCCGAGRDAGVGHRHQPQNAG